MKIIYKQCNFEDCSEMPDIAVEESPLRERVILSIGCDRFSLSFQAARILGVILRHAANCVKFDGRKEELAYEKYLKEGEDSCIQK
jgi:hypothetical protein